MAAYGILRRLKMSVGLTYNYDYCSCEACVWTIIKSKACSYQQKSTYLFDKTLNGGFEVFEGYLLKT